MARRERRPAKKASVEFSTMDIILILGFVYLTRKRNENNANGDNGGRKKSI